VRTYAEYAFATGRTGMDPSDEMYTTLEKVLFLQRIPLFADVPPEHLVALARSAEVERRAAGATVFRAGDPGDALYFVIDGKVRVLTPERAPIELGEGEVFGEMSVLDSSPRSAAVEVAEDSTLLRIAQEDFYDVLHETAELAEGVIHVLVRRLRGASPSG
jgi:CRP-like cAMP-binding protein